MKPRIIIELGDLKLREAMRKNAKKQNRTMKFVIQQAMREYLKRFSKDSVDIR